MKKLLMMILCLIICAATACAEDSVSISAEGEDWMSYAFTLPDGRMIFTGSRGKVGNYQERKARLLCLNPDRTVSWEYWDPAEGYAHFRGAALLADGTIGVVYINSPYQETEAIEIRHFSAEGEPIGAAIDIFGNGAASGLVDDITSACIRMDVYSEDGKEQRGFLDWNGDLLFSFDRRKMIGVRSTFAAGDGLVLAGNEVGGSANAKIMKVDLQGNIIWETVLPMMMQNGARAWIDKCAQTPDGGYLAWILESDDGSAQWAYALARFDQNGRRLWLNRESFDDNPTIGCTHLMEYQGKAVMLVRDNNLGLTQVFRWFDEAGNEIGTTELILPWEESGRSEDRSKAQVLPQNLIIMEDGLWVLNDLRVSNDDVLKEMDSKEDILYKVPELV